MNTKIVVSSQDVKASVSTPALQIRGVSGEQLKWRIFDIVIATAALIALTPLILVTCAAIAWVDRGPVFFVHRRAGLGGRSFNLFKFKTMRTDAAEFLERHLEENPEARREWQETRKLRNDPRITSVGRLLRRTSVDELPQLINVILGDMSIVGPRPVTFEELATYGGYRNMLLSTKPGITGLWQISGRSDIDLRSRVYLDINYVVHKSLKRDVQILASTLPVILSGRGSF